MENVECEREWQQRSHLCTYEPMFIMHMKNSCLNETVNEAARTKDEPTRGDNDKDEAECYRKSNALDSA